MHLPFSPDDIDAVLFDMDGTVINTDDTDVARWARRAARFTSDQQQAENAARRLIMAMETPVNTFFTLLDLVGLDTPVIRLLIALQGGTDTADLIPPIVGVEAMLEALAEHYTLGVVSTRTVSESERHLVAMGVRDHMGVIVGRDTTWRIKPHPQPVKHAARKLGIDPMHCLMVGDTTVDVKSGIRAGAWTCAVLCGYGERPELERAGADVILDHTTEIGDLLLKAIHDR